MIKKIFLSIFCLTACSPQTEDEKWEGIARASFHEFTLWEDARMMNAIEFTGPVIKKNIENFKTDTNMIIFAWYHVHSSDTFWVYCKIDKLNRKNPTMHSSKNYDQLGLNWEEWYGFK